MTLVAEQVVDGRYRVVERLGEGGMGQVFLAEHVGTGAHVAIKVLTSASLADDRAKRRFELEARNAAVLRHNNTVRIFDYGIDRSGLPYLVMEHLSGRTLVEEIHRTGRLPWRRAAHIAAQVLKSLWEAHEHPRGIVHRDIKASNILLVEQPGDHDVVKVFDFGVSRALGASDADETADQMGSPQTMAPEQWQNRSVGPQADLYALGCVTYHMLAGRPPFQAANIGALGLMHLTKRAVPLAELAPPGTPPALTDWVEALLRKDPLQRPPSARAALEVLQRIGNPDSTGDFAAVPDHGAPDEMSPDALANDTVQISGNATVAEWLTLPEVTPAAPLLTNLQQPYSTFIGRDDELDALDQLVESGARLITVQGPPGTGKTRLAREWGLRSATAFTGGVWFCDLTQAITPEGVCSLIGTVLDVPLVHGDPIDQLGTAIRSRGPTLLILDTFEQVVDHADATVGGWMTAAPEARFLVTSRERLGLRGEKVLGLDPLSLPAPSDTGVDLVASSQSVALFLDRARALDDSFELTVENAADVAEIVRRLDGMPLAIELAAARARLLSPRKMLDRLKHRFDLLRGGHRGTPDRQTTLEATLDWSWALLDAAERATLAQCAVFRGGFGLDAAEAVVELDAWPDAPWVLDALESLCDKSLLRVATRDDGEPRFSLFSTIQDYARRKLVEPGAIRVDDDTRFSGPEALGAADERHAGHYATLGDDEHMNELGRDPAVLSTLHLELENLWKAVNWAAEHGRADLAARAARAAWRSFEKKGPFGLAYSAGERVLALPDLSADQRVGLLLKFGWIAVELGKPGVPERSLEEAEALWEEVSLARRAHIRKTRVDLLWRAGKLAEATPLAVEAAQLGKRGDSRRVELMVANSYGIILGVQGRFDEAIRQFLDAAEAARRLGYRDQVGQLLGNLAYAYLEMGRAEKARPYAEEGLKHVTEMGEHRYRQWAVLNLGRITHALGDFRAAREHYEQGLSEATQIGESRLLVLNRLYLTDLDLDAGFHRSVERGAPDLINLVRSAGWPNFEAEVYCRLSRASLEQGNLAAARLRIGQALEIAGRAGEPIVRATCSYLAGRVEHEAGDTETAGSTLEAALAAARECSARRVEGEVLGYLAALRREQNRLDTAQALIDDAETCLRDVTASFQLGVVLAQRAMVEAANGGSNAAASTLEEARALRDQLEVRAPSALATWISKAGSALQSATA